MRMHAYVCVCIREYFKPYSIIFCNLRRLSSDINVQPFEGDVILTKEQQLAIEAWSNPNDPFAPMHAVSTFEQSKWPNGVVYYVYDSSIPGKN